MKRTTNRQHTIAEVIKVAEFSKIQTTGIPPSIPAEFLGIQLQEFETKSIKERTQ